VNKLLMFPLMVMLILACLAIVMNGQGFEQMAPLQNQSQEVVGHGNTFAGINLDISDAGTIMLFIGIIVGLAMLAGSTFLGIGLGTTAGLILTKAAGYFGVFGGLTIYNWHRWGFDTSAGAVIYAVMFLMFAVGFILQIGNQGVSESG